MEVARVEVVLDKRIAAGPGTSRISRRNHENPRVQTGWLDEHDFDFTRSTVVQGPAGRPRAVVDEIEPKAFQLGLQRAFVGRESNDIQVFVGTCPASYQEIDRNPTAQPQRRGGLFKAMKPLDDF